MFILYNCTEGNVLEAPPSGVSWPPRLEQYMLQVGREGQEAPPSGVSWPPILEQYMHMLQVGSSSIGSAIPKEA